MISKTINIGLQSIFLIVLIIIFTDAANTLIINYSEKSSPNIEELNSVEAQITKIDFFEDCGLRSRRSSRGTTTINFYSDSNKYTLNSYRPSVVDAILNDIQIDIDSRKEVDSNRSCNSAVTVYDNQESTINLILYFQTENSLMAISDTNANFYYSLDTHTSGSNFLSWIGLIVSGILALLMIFTIRQTFIEMTSIKNHRNS